MVKNPPASTGDRKDVGSIPGLGRFPEDGHGNQVQCSCLGRRASRATVHRVAESDMTETTYLVDTHGKSA